MNYKFSYNGKEYELNKEKFIELINDEENPIKDITLDKIIEILNESDEVSFDKAYYSSLCEECKENFKENKKICEYLEYYFYIYTKDSEYVISTISKDYENKTYNKLELMGLVDNSYIATVIVCENCGSFLIQIEELQV